MQKPNKTHTFDQQKSRGLQGTLSPLHKSHRRRNSAQDHGRQPSRPSRDGGGRRWVIWCWCVVVLANLSREGIVMEMSAGNERRVMPAYRRVSHTTHSFMGVRAGADGSPCPCPRTECSTFFLGAHELGAHGFLRWIFPSKPHGICREIPMGRAAHEIFTHEYPWPCAGLPCGPTISTPGSPMSKGMWVPTGAPWEPVGKYMGTHGSPWLRTWVPTGYNVKGPS